MKQIKVLQFNSFCVSLLGDFGIVPEGGPFASSAWTISDELFKTTGGSKFAWIAPNGKEYTEDKNIFRRPDSEQQIIDKLEANPILKEKALEMGLIELVEASQEPVKILDQSEQNNRRRFNQKEYL